MTFELDHVVVCVADLESASDSFAERFRVRSVEGGRHEGHGTENRIIPLGSAYIELLAVVDPEEASSSPFGRWAADQSHGADGNAVCLRTEDLDSVCDRLGLEATAMSRLDAEGRLLEWRIAGIAESLPEVMPFFVEWSIPEELHPGRIAVEHGAGDARLTTVAILGDHVAELAEWAPEPVGLDYLRGPYREITYHIASTPRAL